MKRAQSVEVLTVQSDNSHRQIAAPPLPDTFFQTGVSPPPLESPPPLPPREKGLDTPPTIHSVLQSTTLASDNIVIAESKAPPLRATQPKPRAIEPVKPKQPINTKKSSAKKPTTGVTIGVKDRELPKADTVKETRKLFEANDPSSGGSGKRLNGR